MSVVSRHRASRWHFEDPGTDQHRDRLGAAPGDLLGHDWGAVLDPDGVGAGNGRVRGQASNVPAMPTGKTGTRARPAKEAIPDFISRSSPSGLRVPSGKSVTIPPLRSRRSVSLRPGPPSPRAGSGKPPRSGSTPPGAGRRASSAPRSSAAGARKWLGRRRPGSSGDWRRAGPRPTRAGAAAQSRGARRSPRSSTSVTTCTRAIPEHRQPRAVPRLGPLARLDRRLPRPRPRPHAASPPGGGARSARRPDRG